MGARASGKRWRLSVGSSQLVLVSRLVARVALLGLAATKEVASAIARSPTTYILRLPTAGIHCPANGERANVTNGDKAKVTPTKSSLMPRSRAACGRKGDIIEFDALHARLERFMRTKVT